MSAVQIPKKVADLIRSDAPASAARTALGAAPLASPALTGTPTAPTATTGTNTTQIATTAFVLANAGGGGGSGSPGGSSGQIQINSSGSFAGGTSTTIDGSGHLGIGVATINSNAIAHFGADVNSGASVFVTNPNGGTTAQASVRVGLDPADYATKYCGVGILGTGFGGGGDVIRSQTCYLEGAGTNLWIGNGSDDYPIQFTTGSGRAERLRIEPNGQVAINALGRIAMTATPLVVSASAGQSAPLCLFRGVSTTAATRDVATLDAGFVSPTDASRTGYVALSASDYAASREGLRIVADGTQAKIAFFGGTPVAKPATPTTLADVIALLQALNLCS